MTLIERARQFAEFAHQGQVRKYTLMPYITHVEAVAHTVAGVPGATDEMIAAALLHDVVEDTGVTLAEIYDRFGIKVGWMVEALTDAPVTAGNRAQRKALTATRLRLAGHEARTIKLADLIDNTASIVEYDPKFAAVYMREKRDLLPALLGGDPDLYRRAKGIVDAYFGVSA